MGKTKALFFLVQLIFWMGTGGVCFGDFLACDLPAVGTATASRIEVTPPVGAVVGVDGIAIVSGADVKLLDLAP